MITVYSKPGCVQCTATYKVLDKNNVPYVTVDITRNLEARRVVAGLGYSSMPVVVTETGEHWSGFHPEKLKALGKVDAA